MQLDRRLIMGATLGLGAAAAATAAAAAGARDRPPASSATAKASDFGIAPGTGRDETDRLQSAIDRAAERKVALALPAGRYIVRGLTLRSSTHLTGIPGATILEHVGTTPALGGAGLHTVTIEGLTINGSGTLGAQGKGLIALDRVLGAHIGNVSAHRSSFHGIVLNGCSGMVTGCRITNAAKAGLMSVDAAGLEISHNTVADCGNNGILVWRSVRGEDGTIVAMNRIERIAFRDGGTGQNGNGINVFRAGNVTVANNRIADCAYSAIRGHSAADIVMTGNNIARMGEVALYAEFAFDGAVIANNIVDGASVGVSVTNFNDGGRLATVQGNVIRNLTLRTHDRERSGIGISVEADTAISGNVIEKAPTAGITIGWGRYCRDVSATGNIIRTCDIGIGVTSDPAAGSVLIANNMISGAPRGAIRATDHGRPVGNDLTKTNDHARRIQLTGNMVV